MMEAIAEPPDPSRHPLFCESGVTENQQLRPDLFVPRVRCGGISPADAPAAGAADGAAGPAGADRRGVAARRAELDLARIRHAGRCLALFRPVPASRHPADAVDQRAVCKAYPRVAEAAREAGWEFMGHAWEQMPTHNVADQRAMIAKSLDMLERFAGTRPRGWLGAGLTETLETPESLAEAGVEYVGDWVTTSRPKSAPSTGRSSRCPIRSN
jgi:hypothetical protein